MPWLRRSGRQGLLLNYRETTSNDFVLRQGGDDVKMLSTDISEWTISFIDTGIDTAIGERLRRVRPYLDGDEIFLANYGDVLTDAPMNDLIKEFAKTDAVGQLLASEAAGLVPRGRHRRRLHGHRPDRGWQYVDAYQRRLLRVPEEIFDYLKQDEDLVMDACMRAAKDGRFRAAQYDGFWAPMDTLKERSALEEQYRRGNSPWALWRERPVDLVRPVIPVKRSTRSSGDRLSRPVTNHRYVSALRSLAAQLSAHWTNRSHS